MTGTCSRYVLSAGPGDDQGPGLKEGAGNRNTVQYKTMKSMKIIIEYPIIPLTSTWQPWKI
jgi:hypothetical protein